MHGFCNNIIVTNIIFILCSKHTDVFVFVM